MIEKPDGVILAGGFSRRMNRFKPLCPVGGELLIDRIVRLMREGGAERIFAVTGHNRELLEERLAGLGVTPLYNDRYAEGMYSSVRRAVQGLPPDSPGFLLLPVDYPFVLPGTIGTLIRRFMSSDADLIYPVRGDRKGHPPVIRAGVYRDIAEGDGEGGLRKLLNGGDYSRAFLETDDEGILCDADTEEALAELMARFGERIRFGSDEPLAE